MIYRLLGVVALFVGVLMSILTLLVLLPFFTNFNLSLLVLVIIFGLFALVFLTVGWQLVHPPAPVEPVEVRTEKAADRGAGWGEEPLVLATAESGVSSASVGLRGGGAASNHARSTSDGASVPGGPGVPVVEEPVVVDPVETSASGSAPPAEPPVTARPPAEDLDFSWVTPAPRRGATFVGLGEAHTDLEGGEATPPEAEEDPYYLRRHGYFKKPGARVPPEDHPAE